MNLGDVYTLMGGFLYAVHIIVCEKAMKNTSPIIITILQFAFAAVFSLVASLLFEDLSLITQINSSIYMHILYLAFFATTLCYLFQNVGQSWVRKHCSFIIIFRICFRCFLFNFIKKGNIDIANSIRIYYYLFVGICIRNKVIFYT